MEWDEQRATAVREVERLNRSDAANVDAGIRVFELANNAYNLYSERNRSAPWDCRHAPLLAYASSSVGVPRSPAAA